MTEAPPEIDAFATIAVDCGFKLHKALRLCAFAPLRLGVI